LLQAVGRTPNGKKIAADKAGGAVTDRGFIKVDCTTLMKRFAWAIELPSCAMAK